MMITLMNSLGVVLALALLFAFVWGAWRHTVEQTLGCSHLTDLSSGTKIKTVFYPARQSAVEYCSADCYGGCDSVGIYILKWGTMMESKKPKLISNGNYWYRTKGGNWYTFSPDEDASEPWY